MRDLELQEQFELEVLDLLNSNKMLKGLVFTGGTMLRLCWGLNRFSVDIDFWSTANREDWADLFERLKELLSGRYSLSDSANKFYTMIFEIRSPRYPRALKIEIRKEDKKSKVERSIAFSVFSTLQVLVNTVALEDMLSAKFRALIDRREIRDAFDAEFLIKKGIKCKVDTGIITQSRRVIEGFTKDDYRVKLGAILAPKERAYYREANFKILLGYLTAAGT